VADDSFNDELDVDSPASPEEAATLLQRIRSGDDAALSALVAKILPRLKHWAHARLPNSRRSMLDAGDIVHSVATRALQQLAHLDAQERGPVGFYLRQAVLHEIASQYQSGAPMVRETTGGESPAADDASPLERLIGAERVSLYDAALSRLTNADREAIIGRFELAYGYEDLARYLGAPSAATARLAVLSAIKRLARHAAALSGT